MRQRTPIEPTPVPGAERPVLDPPERDDASQATTNCDGSEDDLPEPNDTLDQAIPLGREWRGTFGWLGCIGDAPAGADDVDLVLFDLKEGERLFIETDARDLRGFAENLETVLRVFDLSGTELAVDHQSFGPDLGSFISFEVPADGTYAVGVSGYANFDYDPTVAASGTGGTAIDPYRLKVIPADLSEPSETFDQADDFTDRLRETGSVTLAGFLGDAVNSGHDVDLAQFDLEAGETLLIQANAIFTTKYATFDTVLRAFDPSGTAMAASYYDPYNPYSLLSLRASVDGAYTVGVSSHANRAYDPTVEGSGSGARGPGRYDLTLWFGDLAEPGDVLGQAEDFTAALQETGSLTLTGIIGDAPSGRDDVDLALFRLDAGQVVHFDVIEHPRGVAYAEPILRVFDESGDELAIYEDSLNHSPPFRFEAPAAGTYAVGISSDGNTDYDPTSAEGGSGGYGSGGYRLTVETDPIDLEIGLYNAEGDRLIALIEDGDEIFVDLAKVPGLTIAGIVPEDSPDIGVAGSARLDLNDGTVTRIENLGAFTLFGDPGGDFQGGTIPAGENLITFDLYSENRLQGDFLGSISRGFTLVDVSNALEIGLYDADGDELIALIEDGAEIDVSGAEDRDLTIAAIVSDDAPLSDRVESARLDLNSGAVTQVENFGAFSLFGDPGGDLQGGDIPLGESVITFDLFSENRLQGDFLGSISRNFTIVDPDTATGIATLAGAAEPEPLDACPADDLPDVCPDVGRIGAPLVDELV